MPSTRRVGTLPWSLRSCLLSTDESNHPMQKCVLQVSPAADHDAPCRPRCTASYAPGYYQQMFNLQTHYATPRGLTAPQYQESRAGLGRAPLCPAHAGLGRASHRPQAKEPLSSARAHGKYGAGQDQKGGAGQPSVRLYDSTEQTCMTSKSQEQPVATANITNVLLSWPVCWYASVLW
jgi:hypothetical protein